MTEENIVESDDTQDQVAEEKSNAQNEDTGAASKETAEPEARIAKLEADLKASNEARDKLYARLKRKDGTASDDGSSTQQQANSQQQANKDTSTGLSREEAILIAKGFTEDEIEQAKKVAALEGVKLTEVPQNELFVAWKAKRDADAKKQAAQLGVSRGARTNVKKTLASKELTDDEHKELFKERIGQ